MGTMDAQHRLAQVVRAARSARGMTQAELADAIGSHQQTVGNLERALHATSPDVLREVARVLEVDLSPAALVGRANIELLGTVLAAKFDDLGAVDGLRMVAETLHFVAEWQV